MKDLTERVLEFPKGMGATKTGIATVETLAGGPPSADITYVLPGARSVISYAIPLNQDYVPDYLAKKRRVDSEMDNLRVNAMLTGISVWLANYLDEQGHPSVPLASNGVLRPNPPGELLPQVPPLAHKYPAVRSGIGHFGWSGNVITKEHGASILLGSVVTTAELVPTNPLPEDENYCDKCRLCLAVCMADLMDRKEIEHITLGGIEYSYSKNRCEFRCSPVCTARTGLHRSGKWSTWSPGRFKLPENDDLYELLNFFLMTVEKGNQWPEIPDGGFYIPLPVKEKKIFQACTYCQFVCHPDPEERKRRHELVINSGVMVQNPDGSLEAVSPEEAEKRLAAMNPEVRALYE